jgi:hypothetical protein
MRLGIRISGFPIRDAVAHHITSSASGLSDLEAIIQSRRADSAIRAGLSARGKNPRRMPDKTVKRQMQDCDAALASDDGPIFSTVAKLVEALKRSIPGGTQNAKLKNEALRPCVVMHGLVARMIRAASFFGMQNFVALPPN